MIGIEGIKLLELKYIVGTYERLDVMFVGGDGVYLYDSAGNRYLDFVCGIATSPLGHSHPIVVEAVQEQVKRLINVSNLFYTREQTELAKKLIEIAGITGKVFFSNSGAEAVEAAIKFARKYKGKKEIIATKEGFHGRTMGALSATWKPKYKLAFEPLVPGFKHIAYDCVAELKNNINDNTAAFIVEPIQGEAGVRVPSEGYLKSAYEVCKKHNILVIVDEVQTGLGRTGKFFAHQYDEIKPDIIILAKGLANGIPVGATIVKDEIANCIEKGEHGSTFGGNSLAAYVAKKLIEYILDKNLIEKSLKLGNYFIEKLKKLKMKNPLIKDVRGRGLMIGMDIDMSAKEIVKKALKNHLIINYTSDNTIRFLPPLIIEDRHIDYCVSILEKIIN